MGYFGANSQTPPVLLEGETGNFFLSQHIATYWVFYLSMDYKKGDLAMRVLSTGVYSKKEIIAEIEKRIADKLLYFSIYELGNLKFVDQEYIELTKEEGVNVFQKRS